MEEVITKRLLVSGLTPSLTIEDLSKRLGTFGTVKALDGFGLLDGVGQPRKFGYVSLETTKKQVGRCMNLLSGVTWKGAKLRIGEAKPDFRERLEKERADAAGEPPKKRRRLPRGVQGVHAADMSLVTPENVATRSGWRVTPTGRMIRPIRMRPEHPLPEPLPSTSSSKSKKIEKAGKKRKRVRDPPTRARRKTIDPTKYGSQQLKGAFLESAVTVGPAVAPLRLEVQASEESEEDESGTESVDSDVEMNVEASARRSDDPEAVAEQPEEDQTGEASDAAMDVDVSGSLIEDNVQVEEPQDAPRPVTQTTKLKDLFAPQEEEVGFSLLGHLDLDLELDDDVELQAASQHHSAPDPRSHDSALVHTPAHAFDPKRPRFFPLLPDERRQGRVHDVVDPTNWRSWFFRADTAEDIHKRWEDAKGELTSEWKRRHREAVKSRRRRGGQGDGEL
ncbi:hypothetical protein POSPLADRAFT_1136819 [Postia placenta MAD-698-R-SB12]|uniref:RRM domain-containing protein n=1 Tax=Postia placenta MAD-698-R-SB12 TaxID=670580 RepID=A0A1X6N5X4_9APHY|nr:hypothetical protein POSPLADRAFT_1136819 [Postia placenta MAD-698-R-SB12]OSX64018.1 hypothetical protein POSPLADRAFT_1136819 [Postia placenta MAD-698-R-SB12]